MKEFSSKILWMGTTAVLLFAVALCPRVWAEGGESVEHRAAFRQKPDERKGDMRERQEKARKEMQKAIAEAVLEAEERDKKQAEKNKGKKKKKDKKDGSGFIAAPVEGARMGRIEFDPKKKKGKTRAPIAIKKTEGETGPRIIEFKGARDSSIKSYREGTHQFLRPDGSGLDLLKGDDTRLINPPERERSFFDKLFGRKKDLVPQGRSVADANTVDLPKSFSKSKAEPGKKDSVMRRLAAEMAARRLEQEQAQQIKTADPKDLPKAAVVDPEAIQPKGPLKPAVEQGGPIKAGGVPLRPKPEEDGVAGAMVAKQEAEKLFQRGLASRDLVLREAAYRYAARYRRREAIPFLMADIERDGVLATVAAACLGAMGPADKEMEKILLDRVTTKDAFLRQNCIESLGHLRVDSAVKPMEKLLETEMNYRVRAAICEALGRIGNPKAINTLRARVFQRDEIQLVKAQAALALARLGDKGGRKHLLDLLVQDHPALQVLGLAGLVRLKDPGVAGYLTTALASRFDEVWVSAVHYFPEIGPERAVPILRSRLHTNYSALRRRAALAMGVLGVDEGAPYIAQALKVGNAEERKLASKLLGALGRTDYIPLLIESLRDPQSQVRVNAIVSLAALDAKEALPELIRAARGARAEQIVPPAMRSVLPDVAEMANLLAAIRILQGADKAMTLKTLPSGKSTRWPEFDQELFKHQIELVKSYQVVAVLGERKNAQIGVLAILKDPSGQEHMLREGEPLAAGFRVRSMSPAALEGKKEKSPAFVTLFHGDTRVILIAGREPQVEKIEPRK